MPQATVTATHIRWRDPIAIRFGFSGITNDEAISLAKNRLTDQFPDLDKPHQCVYVVRLRGEVAISYGADAYSPVVYIGEGNAANRLKGHAEWFAGLLMAIPNAEIEVRVADCVRQMDKNLCQFVEADLLRMFVNEYSCLPWFNRQLEPKHEGKRLYSKEVQTAFRQRIGKVQGARFRWAIRPTPNNSQYLPYRTGWYQADA